MGAQMSSAFVGLSLALSRTHTTSTRTRGRRRDHARHHQQQQQTRRSEWLHRNASLLAIDILVLFIGAARHAFVVWGRKANDVRPWLPHFTCGEQRGATAFARTNASSFYKYDLSVLIVCGAARRLLCGWCVATGRGRNAASTLRPASLSQRALQGACRLFYVRLLFSF